NMTEDEKIADVQIEENQILFKDKDGNEYRTGVVNDPQLTERLHKANVSFNEVIKEKDSPFTDFLIAWILPILIFFGVGYYFNRKLMNHGGGNSLMFGAKNQVKVYVPSANGIHFDDVAGEDEAKENLSEIVDFLHHPDKYAKIGAKMPKGVLLVGPPGTGKTMLAKAVAGEAGVPFFPIAGSEFVEMFVGMGASKVRDLFQQAKQKAPCIIFIDEIDAIGQKRTGNAMGNSEREQTLNQLLTEMDGFNADDNVVILAATNRPESLDPALLRPGRFDRRVPVELPDLAGREAILKAHAKKVALGDDVDFHTIARMAAGASGAELANIVNEAALRAIRDHRDAVSQADLEESIEVVIAGYQKKNAILSDDEKKTVAYHEIGHALVAALQSHSAPVQKITIIPRTSGALGYTMQVDQQDKYILSREELENKIATLTGGRAAEEVVFNQVTTGASNDIEQATKLARAMITRYGMADEFDMVAMETVTNKYLGGDTSLACAPETQKYIDAKVVSVVKEQHAKAKKILEDHRPALDALAKYLYEKETITGKEFMDILRAQTAGRD
uniref:ATP-dependent zinc metalloprotease FtsH n=1 Tax=Megasphaera sp. TaxID=2023260 RepID=UPI0040271366